MGDSKRSQSRSRAAPSGSASVVSEGNVGRSRSASRGLQNASMRWAALTSQGNRGQSQSQSRGTQDGSESVSSGQSGWLQRPTRAQSQPRPNLDTSSSQSSKPAGIMSTLRSAMKQDSSRPMSTMRSAMKQDLSRSPFSVTKQDSSRSISTMRSAMKQDLARSPFSATKQDNEPHNEITNQVTGNSVQSYSTAQTTRSRKNIKSAQHLGDQSSSHSRQTQVTPQDRSKKPSTTQEPTVTPENGSNIVIVKKKGILKNTAEPAPIQPIVKSILKQQQQRRGSESSVQSSGQPRPILKKPQRRGSESSGYTTNTQLVSNMQLPNPSVPQRSSLGGSSTADISMQQQDEYELAFARSRSTSNAESRAEQDCMGSQYEDRGAILSDGDNMQPTTQSQAQHRASNGQNTDLYSGPYTRTRQRAISMGGANDGYTDVTSEGPTGDFPMANFAYSERAEDNDSRSFVSSLTALSKTSCATSGINPAIGKRFSGGDDDAKSVVSSTSASKRVQIVDSNDAKSVNKNPYHDDTTSVSSGMSNLAKRVVHSFKKITVNDDDDARSVISSGSALTSRSYLSYASSSSRKFRSASAPKPGRVDDDDNRSVVSSGSALTTRSYVSYASTGSRRSRSAPKPRHDDDDTRSVVTTSSARALSRRYGADDDDNKSVMTSQSRGSVSSNRSRHRPAPNSWDLDRNPSSRRQSLSDDDKELLLPKTPALKMKESAQMASELRDAVMSSLLTQQRVGEVTSRDAITLQAETNMDMNNEADYLVANSLSGQVSTDLKKYALRIQMGSLRHHLDDYQRSKSLAVLIPPTPPLSEKDDKRGYINPFETPDSAASFDLLSDEQMERLAGHKEAEQWTPSDSAADSLSEPGGWSPPNSNPRTKKRVVAEKKSKVQRIDISSDKSESKETKDVTSAKKMKKKKSKESKSKDEKSTKKKPDRVAKVANDLKAAVRCLQMEQEPLPCNQDLDNRAPEWTVLPNPALNGQGRGGVDGEEIVETKKPGWMADPNPDALEPLINSGRRAGSTDDDDDAASKPESKPAKSTRKTNKM